MKIIKLIVIIIGGEKKKKKNQDNYVEAFVQSS